MNGSIRRRGKNSWELTIDLGRDEHGKRLRKFVNVTKDRPGVQRKDTRLYHPIPRTHTPGETDPSACPEPLF